MKYPKTYIMTRDIDWFCTINAIPIHIASAGGELPDEVNDRETLRDLQKRIFDMQEQWTKDVIIKNEAKLQELFGNDADAKRLYLESFEHFAKKGFVSFDRDLSSTNDVESYFWVCYPANLRKVNIDGIRELSDGTLNKPCLRTLLAEIVKLGLEL